MQSSSLLSDEVAVRSLRRRLWRAFQEGDEACAIRAYTATRADFDQWISEEEAQAAELERQRLQLEALRLAEKKGKRDRPNGFKRFSSRASMRSPRKSLVDTESRNLSQLEGKKPLQAEEKGSTFETKFSPETILLQELMNPSDLFRSDDFRLAGDSYDDLQAAAAPPEPPPKPARASSKRKNIRRNSRPRMAFFLGRRRRGGGDVMGMSEDDQSSTESEPPAEEPDTVTTPLHEAARVGSGTLVRLMLAHGGNPNIKNGKGRTALHMIAGGLLESEIAQLEASRVTRPVDVDEAPEIDVFLDAAVGIRTPVVEETQNLEEEGAATPKSKGKKRAMAVSRFFNPKLKQRHEDPVELLKPKDPPRSIPAVNLEEQNSRMAERMDALMSIMTWCHAEDGEGISINSVDSRGRTALHYAAEVGRDEICTTLMSSFGTMLTVVDESSRTPCELAGEQGFNTLAAELEARALLYIDPYGMDDDLMASVLSGAAQDQDASHRADMYDDRPKRHPTKSLAPPFCWFETWSADEVQREREWRIDHVLEKMRSTLNEHQQATETNAFLMNHGLEDSMDRGTEEAAAASEIATSSESANVGIDTVDEPERLRDAAEVPADTDETTTSGQNNAVNTDAPASTALGDGTEALPNTEESGESGEHGDGEMATADRSDAVEHVEQDEVGETNEEIIESPDCPATNVGQETSKEEDGVTSATGERPGSPITNLANDTATGQGDVACASGEGEGNVTHTTDMPVVSISQSIQEPHAESLLESHGWDVDLAIKAFETDPEDAMKKVGVDLSMKMPANKTSVQAANETKFCLICCEEFDSASTQWRYLYNCCHEFCSRCLGEYISDNAKTRTTGLSMPCPHHECSALIAPLDLVDLVPNSAIYQTLLKTSNENFISTASDLRYCPHPGCTGVVKRFLPDVVAKADISPTFIDLLGAVCTKCNEGEKEEAPLTYEGVKDRNYLKAKGAQQPQRAHRFCFACGEKCFHWPILCEGLEKWKADVAERIGDSDDGDETNFEDVAQKLWMKTNTRPCPECKAPIEKMDGCNHMTCKNRNCKYEFCWICMQDWKLHGTSTGGFFRCNRWEEDKDHEFYDKPGEHDPDAGDDDLPERRYGNAVHSSVIANRRREDMDRFLHHYRRFNGHEESAKLERIMSETVCDRLAPVVDAAIEFNGYDDFDFSGMGISFVHAAFIELLECRSLLKYSYAFAYHRYPKLIYMRHNRPVKLREREKMTFEQFQADLEIVTENLSDIVARRRLRATQTQIMFLTGGAAEKRRDFSLLMLTILNDEKRANEARVRPPSPSDLGNDPFRQMENAGAGRLQHGRRTRLTFLPQGRMRTELFPETAVRAGLALPPEPFERYADVDEVIEEAMRAAHFPVGDEATATNPEYYRWTQWPCSVCTYMNTGGTRCAMCGAGRGEND